MGTGEMQFSQLLSQGSQFVQQQRPDLAIPLLEQAVAFEPNSFEARFWLGAAYGLAKRYQEAAEQLEIACKLRPDVPSAWFNLGQVYWRQGRNDEAIRCFQETLKIDPNHAGARQALDALMPQKPKLEIELTPMEGEPSPKVQPKPTPPTVQRQPTREERLRELREQEERAKAVARRRTKVVVTLIGLLAILLSIWQMQRELIAIEQRAQKRVEKIRKLEAELQEVMKQAQRSPQAVEGLKRMISDLKEEEAMTEKLTRLPKTPALVLNTLVEILVPLLITLLVFMMHGLPEELPAGLWREGVLFVTLGAICGNLLFNLILRPIVGLILLPLVFLCPLMCLVQIAVDIFLRAAAMFPFIVAVCEYVLGMHLESTYHPSWQISLATSIVWFLLSLVGIGLIIGVPLIMR